MNETLTFDGRVAIVTGAGRGLGRSYALMLAERGGRVVVNDLGGSSSGEGADPGPAAAVVEEIRAAGGIAVASTHDVNRDAQGIVDLAIGEFGQLDIVVNNAGINREAPFGSNPVDALRKHMEVNFIGSAAVVGAAWPHLLKSDAPRVVNTTSPTIFGFPEQTPYVSSKGAVFAFTRTLAMEAEEAGIVVNAIAPTAATRMSDEMDAPEEFKQWMRDTLPVNLVAPLVVYLAHESCTFTGETIMAMGGRVQRVSLSMNEGYTDRKLTPESIAGHIDEILDPSTSEPAGLVGEEGTKGVLDMVQSL